MAVQLEQWTACVESLGKYGTTYFLGLLFRVTALHAIMAYAGDRVDDWQRGRCKTPDAMTEDAYGKLQAKREDWARKRRIFADAR